jgi:RNA polymerase sigma-70 factor, ECF subfamily
MDSFALPVAPISRALGALGGTIPTRPRMPAYDRSTRPGDRSVLARPRPGGDATTITEGRLPEQNEAQAIRRAEDVALMARIVARDERAVEALYERYSGPLYSLAYQVTQAERFAQDVVQEVFIALWRDASRFDPARGSVAPWLFSLARHKAIDLVRREANVRKRTADVDLEFEPATDDVDREVWLNIQRERVREAVEELSPIQREALELAFFRGLTHVEVSEELGIPLGTAKTRIRSALLRMRDILGDSLTDQEPGVRARA